MGCSGRNLISRFGGSGGEESGDREEPKSQTYLLMISPFGSHLKWLQYWGWWPVFHSGTCVFVAPETPITLYSLRVPPSPELCNVVALSQWLQVYIRWNRKSTKLSSAQIPDPQSHETKKNGVCCAVTGN